jgi:hypothetical protein
MDARKSFGKSMNKGSWAEALLEISAAAATVIARLWKQAIVHVGLSLGLILVMALPFIIVLLVFWYLESSGWRPQGGFYKIGHVIPMRIIPTIHQRS